MIPPAARADPGPLAPALAAAPPLAALPDAPRAALVAAATVVELAPGAVLLSSDDAPPALYVVIEGVLVVEEHIPGEEPARVRDLGAGELLDQLQVLAGRSGAVSVRAEGPARLAHVPDAVRDALAVEHREVAAMLERLHRDQLYCRLYTLFGAMDRPLLDELEATADWVHLRRGKLLIEQENIPDALYLVISGRLRTVRVRRDGSVRVLSEAGRGETVGELSFFGCDPRGERVEAVRDSVLVGFTDEEFQRLVAHRPRMLRSITRMVVDRASRPDGDASAGRVTNVAVLAASPGAPLQRFCERLRDALEPHGNVLHLTAERVDAAMSETGISGAWGTSPRRARLLAWLEARELDHRFVIYEADPGASPWTRRCLRQADRVLLVASAEDPAEQGPVERALDVLEDRATDAQEVLVLVHRDGGCLPAGTARWRAERTVADHLHLRWDGDGDFHRLARVLAGRSVGVVLGGGGARGFAHIGVLRALEEAGVPVDAIGGTSMGAAVAAQYALGMTPAELLEVNRRIYLEWRPQKQLTLPMVALVDNRLAQLCGTRVYGEAEIEDLWIPYFCVTSNLSSAEMVVHTRGLLRRYVLASASIPVFAPPVLDGDQLLVDGALLNNLPTDVMRAQGHGVVIASEVSLEEDLRFTAEHVPTAWEVVRGRLRLRARPEFPGIMEMAMRASLLHSTSRERSSLEVADLCFSPPVEAFALMDFERIDAIVETGYAHASKLLAEHAAQGAQGAAGSAVGTVVPSVFRPS
jgi:predicted acylesterase/phospholipase RssA/CRP-like cAMP-binding protein